jgi:hypothetical protein
MRVKRRGAVGEAVDSWGTRDVELSACCFHKFERKDREEKSGQIASDEEAGPFRHRRNA